MILAELLFDHFIFFILCIIFLFFGINVFTYDPNIRYIVFNVLWYIVIAKKKYLQRKVRRLRPQFAQTVRKPDAAFP